MDEPPGTGDVRQFNSRAPSGDTFPLLPRNDIEVCNVLTNSNTPNSFTTTTSKDKAVRRRPPTMLNNVGSATSRSCNQPIHAKRRENLHYVEPPSVYCLQYCLYRQERESKRSRNRCKRLDGDNNERRRPAKVTSTMP